MLAGGPTKIYEALLAGLGLDEFVRVREVLSASEGEQGKLWDVARKTGTMLGEQAKALAAAHAEEPRFATIASLLEKKTRDVDAIDGLVSGTTGR